MRSFALAALLLGGALLAAEEAPRPAPDLSPLPPGLAARMEALIEAAERYRGLELAKPVPYGTMDRDALRRKLAAELRKELPPERLDPIAAALKAFGLIPERMDLATYYPELLTGQVAGFYDADAEYLALVQTGGLAGGEEDDPAARAEEAVLVHEVTHAIQDQHFGWGDLADADPLADATAARAALLEGDAMVTMLSFLAQRPVEEVPGYGETMGALLADPGRLLGMAAGMPGGDQLADAPAYLRDSLLFSYFQGLAFCLSVRERGGQRLLDHAFAQDPPRSTEQILHPEKWHGRRDEPVALAWPDLGGELPAHRLVIQGELGEAGIQILLREGEMRAAAAAAAAQGWGGDRFAFYRQGSERLLLWITEWDAEAEAAEFLAAAARLRSFRAVRSGPTRVTLVRGDLPRKARAAVEAELAAARAERRPGKDIDLAALGIAPDAGSPE